MKQQINLTESKLKEIVAETVKKVLKEDTRFIGNHPCNIGKKVYEFDVEVIYRGTIRTQGRDERDAEWSISDNLPRELSDGDDLNLELADVRLGNEMD